MKKSILFFLAAIGFFILPSSNVLAQATVVDSHFEADAAGTLQTCDGTVIEYTGHEVYDTHGVYNKNRANVNAHARGSYTGVDAAGNTYVAQAYYNQTQNVPVDNGAFTITYNYKYHFVSQGSAPDFYLTQTVKVTVNANGEATVERFDVKSSCD